MINYSESGRDLSEFLKDNFLNVKTPLDNFSIERSRDTRVSLGKKFNTDDSWSKFYNNKMNKRLKLENINMKNFIHLLTNI